MNSNTGGPDRVAAAAIIDTWTAHDWRDGLLVNELMVHDRLSVRTQNNLYAFIMTTPHLAEVLVRGGAFFPEFTPVRVAGCSLGGSFLKLHGIYKGFRIELVTETQTIITSLVEAITIVRGDAAPTHLM